MFGVCLFGYGGIKLFTFSAILLALKHVLGLHLLGSVAWCVIVAVGAAVAIVADDAVDVSAVVAVAVQGTGPLPCIHYPTPKRNIQ